MSEENSNLLITKNIDKNIYYKVITKDKVINITGESGSGKSTYTMKYMNNEDYIVIDTDNIFSNFKPSNKYEEKLYSLFTDMYGDNWQDRKQELINDFDKNYNIILDELKQYNKIIVIDSAHYRYMKNLHNLKGEIFVLRTSIDNCYQRVLERYKIKNNSYTKDEFENYKKKKLGMYSCYNKLNEFLIELDKL